MSPMLAEVRYSYKEKCLSVVCGVLAVSESRPDYAARSRAKR